MIVGDEVKIKIKDEWQEGIIICVYTYPEDWSLVDIELFNGDILRGISSRELYGS